MKIIKLKHVKYNNQYLKECSMIIQALNIKNNQEINQRNQLGTLKNTLKVHVFHQTKSG